MKKEDFLEVMDNDESLGTWTTFKWDNEKYNEEMRLYASHRLIYIYALISAIIVIILNSMRGLINV